jgi:hypothetical protein
MSSPSEIVVHHCACDALLLVPLFGILLARHEAGFAEKAQHADRAAFASDRQTTRQVAG